MERIWLSHYPPGIPAEVNVHEFASLKDCTLCLITILSGFEINNFVGQPASGSAITLLPCLTCFGSGSEPCFADFGHAAV